MTHTTASDTQTSAPDSPHALPGGCRMITLTPHTDTRGALCFVESMKAHIPFPIQRVFWIYDVPACAERGSHAHRTCSEVIIPMHGSFTVEITDGRTVSRLRLTTPTQGLLIPPMVWCRLEDFAPSTVCLCLASGAYEPEGYIHDKGTYLKEING